VTDVVDVTGVETIKGRVGSRRRLAKALLTRLGEMRSVFIAKRGAFLHAYGKAPMLVKVEMR
jgi:hypothetical protein